MKKLMFSFFFSFAILMILLATLLPLLWEIRAQHSALANCFCHIPLWGNDGQASRDWLAVAVPRAFYLARLSFIALLFAFFFAWTFVSYAYVNAAYAEWERTHG